MNRIILFYLLLILGNQALAQVDNAPKNLASVLISNTSQKLNIGGYGQVDFSTALKSGIQSNASLDVSRMVMSFGYRFSDKTQFLTEIEFEHVRELYVEQAFLNHSFADALNFRAGLMLIPMGIINEYHEPTTFNGVSRPMLDNVIIPTTWREIGAGFSGRFQDIGLKYQVYLVNGFNGYGSDDKGYLTGSGFLRGGRQKGAKSYLSAPNLTAKLDYYGIMGLKVGLSGYFGETQSSLFNNLDRMDPVAMARTDSSVVAIATIGLDLRYDIKGFHFRGQWIYSSQGNSSAYNQFTGNDLGSAVSGYYLEAAYNLLKTMSTAYQLIPFVRFEHYDTHYKTDPDIMRMGKYRANEWVVGLGWKPAEGAVYKIDIRLRKTGAEDHFNAWLNAGIGVWF